MYNDYGGSFLDCLHAVDRNTNQRVRDREVPLHYGLLHVLPDSGQLNAYVDERRHRGVPLADRRTAPRL